MRILWIELRRSPFSWIFFPVGLLAALVILNEHGAWENVWPEASVRVIAAATQLPGVAVAAVAAWSAQRVHRGSMTELLEIASRPRWQIEGTHLFGTLAYSFFPLVVTSCIAVYFTSRNASFGFLWPSYMFLGVAAVVIVAALGHAVGSILKSRLAAPIAGFLSFFPLFIMSLLVPFFGEANREVGTIALMVRVLLALTCLVAALTLGGTARWGRRSGWRRVSVGLTVGVAASAVIAAGPPQVEREAPAAPACASVEATRVCLWPENAARLPAAAEATRQLISATRDIFPYPKVVAEEGLDVGNEPSSIRIAVLAGATKEAFRSLQVFSLTWLFMAECGASETETHGRPRMQARAKVDTWLSSVLIGELQSAEWDSRALGQSGRQEVRGVLGLPMQQQKEWARRQVALMGACDE